MKKNLILMMFVLGILFLSGCNKDNMITNITLSESSISLNIGESKDLIATFTPEKATNNVLTWTSDNMAVATVTNGKVIGVSYGETLIRVTDSTKKISKSCKVKVNVKDYTWDGNIPSSKPESLVVKDTKETVKLINGNEVAFEVIELNTLNEFIYFFKKMKIEDIAKTNAVLIKLKNDFYLGGHEWEKVNFINKTDDYNYCIILDGNMKSLTDVKIKDSLFDLTTSGYLEIRNLKVKQANLNTTSKYAGIFNSNDTANVSYQGCEVYNSNINGIKYVGGIAAYGGNSSFINCKLEDITIGVNPSDTSFNVGGIVGLSNAGTISGCELKNVKITQTASSLSEEAKRLAIVAGVLQSEVVIMGDITINNCLVNGIKVNNKEKVIYLDQRANKDYSKIVIS